MTDDDELLTINEAAELLTLQPEAVRQWIKQRKIKFLKIGGFALRIPRKEVEKKIQIYPAQPKRENH